MLHVLLANLHFELDWVFLEKMCPNVVRKTSNSGGHSVGLLGSSFLENLQADTEEFKL